MHSDGTFGSWYEKNHPFLSGHGLWLRGGEWNMLSPSLWSEKPLRALSNSIVQELVNLPA